MGTVLEPRTLNLLSSGRCLCFLKPRGVNPDHCFKNNFGNHSRTYHNPPQTICMMSVSWPTVERTSCIESPNTYKGACGDPGDLPGSARKAKCKAVKCLQMQPWLMRTTWAESRFVGWWLLEGFTDPLGRDTPQVLSPFLQKICSWRVPWWLNFYKFNYIFSLTYIIIRERLYLHFGLIFNWQWLPTVQVSLLLCQVVDSL